MSIFGTHSRAGALASTRGPRATAPSDRRPHQALPTAADSDDVRRSGDGSIDVEFYKARIRDPPRRPSAVCPSAETARTLRAEVCVRIHYAEGDDDDSSDWRYRPGLRSRHDRRPHPLS